MQDEFKQRDIEIYEQITEGIKTPRELSQEHGLVEGRIRNIVRRIKSFRDGWTNDFWIVYKNTNIRSRELNLLTKFGFNNIESVVTADIQDLMKVYRFGYKTAKTIKKEIQKFMRESL